jgi:hypothetical protein
MSTIDINSSDETEEQTGREARERGRFLARTTDLSDQQARAVAYAELGYSPTGIASRIDSTSSTVKRYLERAAIQYGFDTIYHPKPVDDRGRTKLEPITHEDVLALAPRTREWWVETAEKHEDAAPSWTERVTREGYR